MANGDDPTKPGLLDTPAIKAAREELKLAQQDLKQTAEATRNLRDLELALNDALKAGRIDADDYAASMGDIRAEQRRLQDRTEQLTEAQKAQNKAIEEHKKLLDEWKGVANEAIGDFSKLGGSVASLTKEIMAQAHTLEGASV